MLLIVAHHFVVNSGVLDVMYKTPMSANSIFLFFIASFRFTGRTPTLTGIFRRSPRIRRLEPPSTRPS